MVVGYFEFLRHDVLKKEECDRHDKGWYSGLPYPDLFLGWPLRIHQVDDASNKSKTDQPCNGEHHQFTWAE
jgi:hypothetical protein